MDIEGIFLNILIGLITMALLFCLVTIAFLVVKGLGLWVFAIPAALAVAYFFGRGVTGLIDRMEW